MTLYIYTDVHELLYKYTHNSVCYQLEGGDTGRVSGHLEVHSTLHMYEYMRVSIHIRVDA